MANHISQREAKRLRRRVNELEAVLAAQRTAWTSDWPSSEVIGRFDPDIATMARIETARRLHHSVVCVPQNDKIALFADRITSK